MRSIVLAFLLLVPTLALAAPAAFAPPCDDFAVVPGLGPACKVAGGYDVLLRDGSRIFTHGLDPVPAEGGFSASAFAPRVPPVCVGDATLEYHNVVVYAVAADATNRHAEVAPAIRAAVEMANGKLREEAAEFGVTMDYRFQCEGGLVAVLNATLAIPASEASFSTIVAGMQALGYDSPYAKYWIWYDDPTACACGGVAEFPESPNRSPGNPANVGPHYAVTFGYTGDTGALILMHESGHNLGAVSSQAPDTSGAGHCNDGLDVMCYADGGPRSAYTNRACTDRRHFDCGHDSYFNPRPTSGYVATKWQIGTPLNRFVQGCLHIVTPLQVGASLAVDGVNAAWVDVPAACSGHAYALHAEGALAQVESVVPGVSVLQEVDVCWYAADGALLECHDGPSFKVGTVPAGAAKARIHAASPQVAAMRLSVL